MKSISECLSMPVDWGYSYLCPLPSWGPQYPWDLPPSMSRKSGLLVFLGTLNVEPFIPQPRESYQGEWVVERRQVPSLRHDIKPTGTYLLQYQFFHQQFPCPQVFPDTPEAVWPHGQRVALKPSVSPNRPVSSWQPWATFFISLCLSFCKKGLITIYASKDRCEM